MPRYTESRSTFTSGRLGKYYKGKYDVKLYSEGCLVLENMMISNTGGAYKIEGKELELTGVDISDLDGTGLDVNCNSYSTVIDNVSWDIFTITYPTATKTRLLVYTLRAGVPYGTILDISDTYTVSSDDDKVSFTVL